MKQSKSPIRRIFGSGFCIGWFVVSKKLPPLSFNMMKNCFTIARTANPELCFRKLAGSIEITTCTAVIG
ncbi:MAG: hypothetical protein IJI34_01635 [Clostridia bacterium]|nr:hypothetical protein [Clostridia bacterium]